MQAGVQQHFVSLCMFTQTDLLQQMRAWSKGAVLLQHCVNDGSRYCLMEHKVGAGHGLFREAFRNIQYTKQFTKSLLTFLLNNSLKKL